MPAKISMSINNGNSLSYLAAAHAQAQAQKAAPKVSGSLNSPMVGRIQYARPGCGSCGK
jgi:hypothetical protein